MFKYKHYVPVLKGKRAEFPTLEHLRSYRRITPLFECVPGAAIHTVPRRMSAFWGNNPYFIDLVFLDDEDAPEEDADEHPLLECFAEVAAKDQHAIPVTGTGRSGAYQAALRQIVGNQEHGYAIRLVAEDFEDEDTLPGVIDGLVEYVGAPREDIDMIVDVGSVAHLPSHTAVARMQRGMLEVLPTINEWRTLTVISGAFPTGLGPLARGWNHAPRLDWPGWASLQARPPARRPAFGDYTIAHPDLPPTGRATILAQLRYSTPGTFMIYKGQNAFRHAEGFKQFLAICRDLVERPEFSGEDFSWGDSEIHARATTGGSPGNAETWRTIGGNHHIEMVMAQLANLNGP